MCMEMLPLIIYSRTYHGRDFPIISQFMRNGWLLANGMKRNGNRLAIIWFLWRVIIRFFKSIFHPRLLKLIMWVNEEIFLQIIANGDRRFK